MEDKKLIELIEKNPNRGWAQVMEQYSGLMYYIVQGYIGRSHSGEDVEDCVAEVFAQAFTNWKRYDPRRSSIKAFLATIATRRAIDLFRKKKSVEEIPEDFSSEEEGIEAMILRCETEKELEEALNILKPEERQIVLRRYYLNESSKRIAEAMGTTPAAVDQRLHRALKKLKLKLGGLHYEVG